MHPDVSVLLPVRNADSTLLHAIHSIQHQSFARWELLVLDDGSTDLTAAVALKAASQEPRIRTLHLPPRGIVHALLAGLHHARAPLIARMDADDLAHPDRLAAQLQHLHSNPHVGVVGCLVHYGGDPQANAGYALHVDWTNSLLTPDAIQLNRFIDSPLPHPSVVFRRHLLETHGPYHHGAFPEDYELWLRWLDAGVTMAKVPQALLTWNDPPHRLSRTDPRYSPAAIYELKARYLARELHRQLRGRQLWIWGAGRVTRQRAALLEDHHLPIHGYIDIDPNKTNQPPGATPVVLPPDLPPPSIAVVVSFVANRGARDLIRADLTSHHYREGRDFWCAA